MIDGDDERDAGRCARCGLRTVAWALTAIARLCADCAEQETAAEQERARWLLRNSGPHSAQTDLDDLFGPGREP